MDVAGEGQAPTRQHVLKAAQAAGLSRAVAEAAIDEVLQKATPGQLLEFASSLPLMDRSFKQVHAAMQANHERLS
jgi:hypothetical protein